MSFIPPELLSILHGLEGEQCEFKEWKTKDDFDGLTKYACALANEGGGRIVLGVADQRPRRIVGTRVWPQMENARRSLNQRIHLTTHWEEFQTSEGRVLVITVPRHAYGLPASWDGRAWMRENDSLVPLSEARRKSIWEEIGRDFSSETCPGLSIGDLNPTALDAFRRAWVDSLQARRDDSGQRDAERIEGLGHEQLLRDTELSQADGTLVNAALILFGTRQAVRRHLAQAELVYEFRNTSASGPAELRVEFQEGFFAWHDLLWRQVNEPSRNPRQTFQSGLFVRQLPSFAERPVREAILNAVCHRDYLLGNSIFIRQTPATLTIESPGGLLPQVTVETLLDRQAPRNRRLAEVFQRCRMVERSVPLSPNWRMSCPPRRKDKSNTFCVFWPRKGRLSRPVAGEERSGNQWLRRIPSSQNNKQIQALWSNSRSFRCLQLIATTTTPPTASPSARTTTGLHFSPVRNASARRPDRYAV